MISRLKIRVTRSSVVEQFQTAFMREVREAEALPDRKFYYEAEELGEDEEEFEVNEKEVAEEDAEDEGGEAGAQPGRVSFEEFLNVLVANSKIYRQIVLAATGKPKLDRRLRNLRLIKSQQSYGFLMTLRAGGCSDDKFEKVLKLTESFILRRHICRERTNDNETVFAKLCGVDPADPIDAVIGAFSPYCPSDAKFRSEFASATFPPALIERARYCLEQIEIQSHGDYLELLPGGADAVHVEHIIPQKIKTKKAMNQLGNWPRYLGAQSKSKHPLYVSRIGNLTLFAGELNIGASNNPYERKKMAYKKSALKLTKALPSSYPEFKFEQVDERSEELSNLAVTLWPRI